MSFESSLNKKIYNIANRNIFSDEVMAMMKTAYEDHKISTLDLMGFFYPKTRLTNDQVLFKLNDMIRKQYRPAYHNIGDRKTVKVKDNGFFGVVNEKASERFYRQDNVPEWTKLEYLLIAHLYSINKSNSFISNKTMSIKLEYIIPDETDKELIRKASRKVTDLLNILKTKRGTFNVVQRFNEGQKGSYHEITANWDVIIKLYREFDDKAEGSIRFRKNIRYRIISLLRYFNDKFIENPLGWKELKNKQQKKYLKRLIHFKESEEFHQNRQVVFRWLKRFNRLVSIYGKLNTDYIIPKVKGKHITLEVKDDEVFDVLTYMDSAKTWLEGYGYNTTIKRIIS